MGYPFGDAVRMLLLTGARRNEVFDLEWRELDLDAGTWVLPARRTKNGREHIVYLVPAVVDLLRSVPRFKGCSFVFTTNGRSPYAGFAKSTDHLRNRVGAPSARMSNIGPCMTCDAASSPDSARWASRQP